MKSLAIVEYESIVQPKDWNVIINMKIITDRETYSLIEQYLSTDQLDTAVAVAKMKEQS